MKKECATKFPVRLLEKKQFIAKPLSEVFGFFQRPENLSRITPPWLSFQVLTPPPIPMKNGQLIDYTVKVAGLKVKWTSAILDFEPEKGFVDVQVRGPYQFWHHTHRFEEKEGGVWVEDRVRYAVPGGILEPLIHFLFVQPQLNAIFRYREKMIREILEEKA